MGHQIYPFRLVLEELRRDAGLTVLAAAEATGDGNYERWESGHTLAATSFADDLGSAELRRTVADTVRRIAHPVARPGNEIRCSEHQPVCQLVRLTRLFALVALNGAPPKRFLNRVSHVRIMPRAPKKVLVRGPF